MSNSQKLDTLAQEHGKVLTGVGEWIARAEGLRRELDNMSAKKAHWEAEAQERTRIKVAMEMAKDQEIASLNAELKDADQAIKEVISRKVQAIREGADYRRKLTELESAVRALMDETDMDGEGAPSRELRQWVWNQADTDERIRLEGLER